MHFRFSIHRVRRTHTEFIYINLKNPKAHNVFHSMRAAEVVHICCMSCVMRHYENLVSVQIIRDGAVVSEKVYQLYIRI